MKFTATTPIYMLFCMLSIVTAVAIPDAAAVGGTGVTPGMHSGAFAYINPFTA